jgi:protein disulfide-isomerase A6
LFNKDDSKALIADVDCTTDNAKNLCQKYGVQGYPTIKYFTASTGDQGEKYEDAREYNALKKFTKKMSRDPCDIATLANCNKKEKAFIEEVGTYDEAKMKSELETLSGAVKEAKTKHEELSALFEKQKDEAMATMKLQEEAQKELDKLSKASNFKIKILEQKSGPKKEEL